jgi:hypothetical protein
VFRVTLVRTGTAVDETVMITGKLCLVVPLSVALTKSPTVPAVLFAVNVTWLAVDELRVPMAGLVRVHAYVAPDGHAAEHAIVVMNGEVVSPIVTVAAVGETDTEVREAEVTVITTGWL